jgi:hypothetical protein
MVHSEEVSGTVRHVEHKMGINLAGIMFDIKINDTGFPIFNHCLEYLKTHE